MKEFSAAARKLSAETVTERFTNQKRFIASEKQASGKWGLDGKGFKCGMCGYRFKAGDGVRWVYANGGEYRSAGNFMTCDACDGPDILQRRAEAVELASSLDYDELVLAAKFLSGQASQREADAKLVEACLKKPGDVPDIDLLSPKCRFVLSYVAERIRKGE